MNQLRIILLLTVFNLLAIGLLSAYIAPDSPKYDAWKQEQMKSIISAEKPTNTEPAFGTYTGAQREPGDLLVALDGSFSLAMSANDDSYSPQLMFPFVFSLYGELYGYFWINNNGNVSFTGGVSSYTPWGFPIAGYPMIAPFFADVDTRGAGSVWYKIESNRVIIIWDGVGYYGSHTDKLNTFELILTDGTDPTIGLGNTVAFSYADMAWTTGDASDGDDGFGGYAATVGINKGDAVIYDQVGRFDHPGLDYDGPYGANDGVDWLDGKVFYFSTGSIATMTIVPTDWEDVLEGIDPPDGAIPGDPNTFVYLASYPDAGEQTVRIPVGQGSWTGWVYYGSTWYPADVSPMSGPGTVVFSDVPFGGRFSVPIVITREDPTLPVELSSFTATQTAQNFVKLTWISESESGMLGYRVYRNDENSQHSAMMITPTMIGATNTSTTHIYDYTDPEVEANHTYWYWLESVDYGSSEFYGPVSYLVEDNAPALTPEQTVMRSAYPNPFKASTGTTIEVDVKDNDSGNVTIYNLIGQEIQSFSVRAGNSNINWDGKDSSGKSCATGVYFYKLSTSSLNQTRKMLIIK